MDFNEQNLVIIDSMDKSEASAFVKFLESEVARHEMDIDNAQRLMYTVINQFGLEG